ncbi:TetR/AcrR family transcriptional regulator [uncultured Amnibacterium sp.]|uniref:TetR/AcrR family transcriptional regulator n=1 Tax=uncultured Amnibacterium sp. TaxID=1631851 RepID=UPI0035C95293
MQRIAVADRRVALLDAAVAVVARDGMARATTRAIAAEAGMPTASFHYVFASYDAMVGQLVEAVLDAQQQGVAAAVGDAATLRDFTAGALQGWLDRASADPDQELALHEVVAWSRSSPELHHLARAVYARYESAVAAFVADAEQRFGVRWRLPSADVARFVLVITGGVAARWVVDRDDAAARTSLAVGAEAVLGLGAEADR